MDVLNFISWLKSKRQVTTVDASQTLIPVGLKDNRRKDGYLPGAISVEDFMALSPGLPSFIKYNETHKTLWNNGLGNSTTNTTFGALALASNSSGSSNTAYGYAALRYNTTGQSNVGVGSDTLRSNTTGVRNIAIGNGAMLNNTVSSSNTVIGFEALERAGGNGNTVIGHTAAQFHEGSGTIAIGNSAMRGGFSAAVNNIAIGNESFYRITTGENNIGIGQFAMSFCQTGGYNVALGYYADSQNFSGSVILGSNATATANNQFVVGSTTYNAGTVVTAAQTQTKYWDVIINGVAQRILLA